MSYVKIASWHALLTYTRSGAVLTRCGRLVPGPHHTIADALPLEERSCESCLRLMAHDEQVVRVIDAPPLDPAGSLLTPASEDLNR